MPIILSAPAKRRKNAPKKGKKGKKEEAQFWRQVEREEAGFVTKAPAKRKNPEFYAQPYEQYVQYMYSVGKQPMVAWEWEEKKQAYYAKRTERAAKAAAKAAAKEADKARRAAERAAARAAAKVAERTARAAARAAERAAWEAGRPARLAALAARRSRAEAHATVRAGGLPMGLRDALEQTPTPANGVTLVVTPEGAVAQGSYKVMSEGRSGGAISVLKAHGFTWLPQEKVWAFLGFFDMGHFRTLADDLAARGVDVRRVGFNPRRKNPSRGYVCVSDRYCPTGDEFSSLADFQRMCVAVFGERARLKASGGNYVDEHGEVVLRPVTAAKKAPARRNGSRSVVDTVAARELELYIENERNLVGPGNSMGANIMRMLAGRIVRGTYDSTKAWKAWVPLVTEGAKRYKREHGAINASKATRDAVATRLSEAFESEVRSGGLDPMKLLGARKNPSGSEIVPPLAQWQKGDYEYSVRGRKGHGNTEYVIRNFSPTGSAWVALAVTHGHVSAVHTGITGTHFVGTTPEAVSREYSLYKHATPGAARAALVKAVNSNILPHARSSRR